ncbi:sugar kinase [Microlunatus endophyticus]|uniref:Sugar kinase n=1 Tax=Microlunatus endophyticus TaxID=1716077 RepID=A0A917SFN3_9ACTN|nr:ROK family transcriptional regulator [Microlunatus endophyticus]GGL73851.1 sugar kinase [Microlunatus endophyticus]
MVAGRTVRDLRHDSRFTLLRSIYAAETVTRQDLVQQTGLSFATVSNLIKELLSAGIIVEASREDSNGGRPRARLRLAPERGLLVGVDASETYVHVDVFDLAMHRVGRHEHPITEDTTDPERVMAEIATGVRTALRRHRGTDVLGVGVSLPGQVEPEVGVSLFAPNWGWKDVPAQRILQRRLRRSVHVDNPLKAATVAELWFGHGRQVSELVTVNLGTGIGAGIASEGRLIRGVSNNAGEWGHTTFVYDGRPCRCGRRGCLEAYIGFPALMAQFAERYPGHRYLRASGQTGFLAAFRAGLMADEPEALWLVDLLADQLGAGLADLVNMLNPRLIVLTSWAALALAPWLVPRARARMLSEAITGSAIMVDLVITAVPHNPVSTGMAALALEEFLDSIGLPSRSGRVLRDRVVPTA